MTPLENNNPCSPAPESPTGAQERPPAETPGRSDAVEAEICPISPGTSGTLLDPAARAPAAGIFSPNIDSDSFRTRTRPDMLFRNINVVLEMQRMYEHDPRTWDVRQILREMESLSGTPVPNSPELTLRRKNS